MPRIVGQIIEIIIDNSDLITMDTMFSINCEDKKVTCHYYVEVKNIQVGDLAFCDGNYEVINDQNIFVCDNVSFRYIFDLKVLIYNLRPFFITKNEKLIVEYVENVCNKLTEYCEINYHNYSSDTLLKMFSDLKNESGNTLKMDFYKNVFENLVNKYGYKGVSPLKVIKTFLNKIYFDYLRRPLELLGLSDGDINLLIEYHIDLSDAYKKIKLNPYVYPFYDIHKAYNICKHHLELDTKLSIDILVNGSKIFEYYDENTNHNKIEEITLDVINCAVICRSVFNNLINKKWTSTPIDRFNNFNCDLIKVLENYNCRVNGSDIYLKNIFYYEKNVVDCIHKYITMNKIPFNSEILFKSEKISNDQKKAVIEIFNSNLSMLIGGPGTGKTTILSQIIFNASLNKDRVLCLCFMGSATTRVRKVVQENGLSNDCDIMTVHMALKLIGKRDFGYKYVIIDEFSMIDLVLFSEFINLIKERLMLYKNIRLILVGDSNQLEPIKYGFVMDQLIKVSVIKKIFLSENFRSIKNINNICNELIDKNRINNKININWEKYQDYDTFNIHFGDKLIINSLLKQYFNEYNELKHGKFENYRDRFVIISPYRSYIKEVNEYFQDHFVKFNNQYTRINGVNFYVGDRVMNKINNYSINVMNGDKGKVTNIDQNYIICTFDDGINLYPFIEDKVLSKLIDFINTFKINIKFEDENIDLDNKKKRVKNDRNVINQKIEELKEKLMEQYNDCKNSGKRKDVELFEQNANLFINLLYLFPFTFSSDNKEIEFFSIKNLVLSYCITTHSSQGDEYRNVIYFVPNKSKFITINNVNTGFSRAIDKLDVVTNNIDTLNYVSFNKKIKVFDKLAENICKKLPEGNNLLEIEDETKTMENDDYEDYDDEEIEYNDDDFFY
jgi:hypothetical protein